MTVTFELNTLSVSDLSFPIGLPGLEFARSFLLRPLGASGPNVFGLLSTAEAVEFGAEPEPRTITLVVAAPGLLWPDYSVEVDETTRAMLELEEEADAAALVIVNLREPLAASTANLFAPIVVNRRLRIASQVVPIRTEEEVGWKIASPLPPLPIP